MLATEVPSTGPYTREWATMVHNYSTPTLRPVPIFILVNLCYHTLASLKQDLAELSEFANDVFVPRVGVTVTLVD